MAKVSAPANVEEARELFTFITNSSRLYCVSATPAIANLKKRYAAGEYNKDLAAKLWTHVAKHGADEYRKEYASDMIGGFSVATRKLCGEKLEDYYFDFIKD